MYSLAAPRLAGAEIAEFVVPSFCNRAGPGTHNELVLSDDRRFNRLAGGRGAAVGVEASSETRTE